jgi:hypothetical protein
MVYSFSGEQENYLCKFRKHENRMYAYSPVAAHEYCQELHQSFYQRTEYPTNSRVASERNTGEPEKWTLQKIKPEVYININISECFWEASSNLFHHMQHKVYCFVKMRMRKYASYA